MNEAKIKEIAEECGFGIKTDPHTGNMDVDRRLYDFAEKLEELFKPKPLTAVMNFPRTDASEEIRRDFIRHHPMGGGIEWPMPKVAETKEPDFTLFEKPKNQEELLNQNEEMISRVINTVQGKCQEYLVKEFFVKNFGHETQVLPENTNNLLKVANHATRKLQSLQTTRPPSREIGLLFTSQKNINILRSAFASTDTFISPIHYDRPNKLGGHYLVPTDAYKDKDGFAVAYVSDLELEAARDIYKDLVSGQLSKITEDALI